MSAFNEGIKVSIRCGRNIFVKGPKGAAKSCREFADLVGLQIFVLESCDRAVHTLAVVRSVRGMLYDVGKSV